MVAAEAFAGFRRTEVMGVPVLWHPDPRFKTFRVNLSARRPLDERAAARSILPTLLMQGTAKYPNLPALARRMESLYGAAVAPSSGTAGEDHVLCFGVDCVAGEFLPDKPDQLAESLDFLVEYLAHPAVDDGGFPGEVFAREQRQAANDARAVFDDKQAWAAERARALAFEGEPMAIPSHGGVDFIEAMDRAAPEQARHDFLTRGQLLVIGKGALPSDEQFLASIESFLANLPARSPEPLKPPVERKVTERRSCVERVDLQQSKMVLVFRLPMTDDSAIWMGRTLFASMLGGGPHSRLFREVREKRSLAYYASAGMDRDKAMMTIHVGLDESAAEAVEAETLRQSEELTKGKFTDEELATAKAGILSSITSIQDGIRSHMRFVEDQWWLGLNRTPEELFEKYQGVDRDMITKSVVGMQLDYSYLLAPSGTGDTGDTGDTGARSGESN